VFLRRPVYVFEASVPMISGLGSGGAASTSICKRLWAPAVVVKTAMIAARQWTRRHDPAFCPSQWFPCSLGHPRWRYGSLGSQSTGESRRLHKLALFVRRKVSRK
jgi:hypothetical protein